MSMLTLPPVGERAPPYQMIDHSLVNAQPGARTGFHLLVLVLEVALALVLELCTIVMLVAVSYIPPFEVWATGSEPFSFKGVLVKM